MLEVGCVTQKQVFELIQKEVEKLDSTKIYFVSAKKLKLIKKQSQMKYLKCCVALKNLGLPITTGIIQEVLFPNCVNPLSKRATIINVLHNFGDKNILVWKRLGKKALQWTVSDWFYNQVL